MSTSAVAIEVRILEGIASSRRPGVLLRLALRSVKVRRRRHPEDARQPALPITRVLMAAGFPRLVPLAPAGALFPWEQVPCRVGGTLMVQACLTRRSKVYPSGGEAGKGGGPKGRPMVLECQGCKLGESYAARSPWFVPPPPSKPNETLVGEQWRAKGKWFRGRWFPEPVGPTALSPMAEAAMLTPDDSGE